MDQDWSDWENTLRTITVSVYYSFMIPLSKWVARSPRIWRFFYDREENCIEAVSDKDGLIRYDKESGSRFVKAQENIGNAPRGVPATVESVEDDRVSLRCDGDRQFYEQEESNQSCL